MTDLYLRDRQANPATRIYTLNPQLFVLSQLFTPVAKPALQSFTATLFRGHLEQGGTPIAGLSDVTVTVARVIHARKFDPARKPVGSLEYVLVRSATDAFLAHTIESPPSFDHVLGVTLPDAAMKGIDPSADVRISFPDRKNVAAQRIKEKEKLRGMMLVASKPGSAATPVEIAVGPLVYFEEGELLVPPSFKPTPEEQKTS